MIIDIHTHCFTDKLASRAIGSLSNTSGLTPFLDGTVAGLRGSMLAAGVDLSIIQPIATKPEQTVSINRWAANLNVEGIISFGTLHPDFTDWREEIKWLAAEGFKGVKFHPEYQDFFVDDPRVFDIYDAIFNAGLIALFHSGNDLSFNEPFHCTPPKLKRILDTFPGAVIIAAHMGGYRYWDEVEELLLGRDVYFDTSFSIQEMGEAKAERLIKQHGTSKILFGSDSPWGDSRADISFIRSLNLEDHEINNILGNNAKKLLKL